MTHEADDHVALVRRAVDTWNDRDLEGFVACYSEPLTVQTEKGDVLVTRDQHRHAATVWWERFPDLVETIKEILVDGDRVFLRTLSSGTHQATWRGIEPTGRHVRWESWYVYRIREGEITEERMIMDRLPIFAELGAVEIPGD